MVVCWFAGWNVVGIILWCGERKGDVGGSCWGIEGVCVGCWRWTPYIRTLESGGGWGFGSWFNLLVMLGEAAR